MKQKKFRPRLWALIGFYSTLVMVLLIGAIFLVFRRVVQVRYVECMEEQMHTSLAELKESNFNRAAASRIEDRGINVVIYRGNSGKAYYRSTLGPMFYLPSFQQSDTSAVENSASYYDFIYLSDLVRSHLGGKSGSVSITEKNEATGADLTDHRMLYLIGREGSCIYGLSMPLANANLAISMAVDYAAVIWSIGLALSLVVIFIASRYFRRSYQGLVRITNQVANLNFAERCKPGRTAEIYELSQSINKMSDHLQADIMELKQTNERLEEELDKRIQQRRINSELVANISHDLKTPIAVISGCAEGLKEGVAATEKQRETYLETIISESEHMEQIISKLTTLIRAENKSVPLTPKNFDLSVLLDEALSAYLPEAEKNGVTVITDYADSIPVHADRESIRQCLHQYLQNARNYVDENKRIRIRAAQEGNMIRVSVMNSSARIPESEIPMLWDKLYRGDNARSRVAGRAGVGLAIVKSYLDRQGLGYGFQNLDAEVGFWFTVPVAAQAETAKSDR